jgi:hypothetical protein
MAFVLWHPRRELPKPGTYLDCGELGIAVVNGWKTFPDYNADRIGKLVAIEIVEPKPPPARPMKRAFIVDVGPPILLGCSQPVVHGTT